MTTDCAKCPLRKLERFDTLKGDELAFMQRFKSGELSIDKGTPILMQGSNSPQLYTVLRGMGIRYLVLPNGRRQVINFVMPGDFIGLQAGIMGEMKHSVDATTSMVLCVFDRSDLWTLFKNQPERAFDLTWLASIQEHFLGDALASVGQMSAVQRMCWGLLRFHQRCADVGLNDGHICPMPFTSRILPTRSDCPLFTPIRRWRGSETSRLSHGGMGNCTSSAMKQLHLTRYLTWNLTTRAH